VIKSSLLVIGLFVGAAITPLTSAPLFSQCPAIGANTGCAVLITVAANGSISTAVDATQGPYDGSEDTLIGVQNNSSTTVSSLNITGSDIFGFDGDGICTFTFTGNGYCSTAAKNGTDPQDYFGPTSTFSITNPDTGTVLFNPGIAPGGSTFFSLEEPPTANLVVTSGAPEPQSFALLGAGMGGLFLLIRRRSHSS
jgi:hypothetical protein